MTSFVCITPIRKVEKGPRLGVNICYTCLHFLDLNFYSTPESGYAIHPHTVSNQRNLYLLYFVSFRVVIPT